MRSVVISGRPDAITCVKLPALLERASGAASYPQHYNLKPQIFVVLGSQNLENFEAGWEVQGIVMANGSAATGLL